MPEPKPARGASFPGFFEHASAWLGTLLAYGRVRWQLAGIEGREAAMHYGILLALALAGMTFVVFGYLFFCLALVFLIARACWGMKMRGSGCRSGWRLCTQPRARARFCGSNARLPNRCLRRRSMNCERIRNG